MNGVSMDEVRESLSGFHDIEFTYRGEKYIMQEECDGIDTVLSMLVWKVIPSEDKCRCLYKNPIPPDNPTPDEYLDAVLNAKCFDGKSFMEIEEEVTVDVIL